MSAGYSKKSLREKLGIRDHARIAILHAPAGYARLLRAPKTVRVSRRLNGTYDAVHFFSKHMRDIERSFPALKKALLRDGSLWISWPKKSSGVATDADENAIRRVGLKHGLVDVKVAAVDDVWSGLKFVYRVKDR